MNVCRFCFTGPEVIAIIYFHCRTFLEPMVFAWTVGNPSRQNVHESSYQPRGNQVEPVPSWVIVLYKLALIPTINEKHHQLLVNSMMHSHNYRKSKVGIDFEIPLALWSCFSLFWTRYLMQKRPLFVGFYPTQHRWISSNFKYPSITRVYEVLQSKVCRANFWRNGSKVFLRISFDPSNHGLQTNRGKASRKGV